MKKINNFLRIALLICFSFNFASSQSDVEFEMSFMELAKHSISIEENMLYKFLDYGSFMEGSENRLNIIPKHNTVFTKVELLNDLTNETIKSMTISEGNNVINLTGVPQGNYSLILTNDTGNIDVEKLTIL